MVTTSNTINLSSVHVSQRRPPNKSLLGWSKKVYNQNRRKQQLFKNEAQLTSDDILSFSFTSYAQVKHLASTQHGLHYHDVRTRLNCDRKNERCIYCLEEEAVAGSVSIA